LRKKLHHLSEAGALARALLHFEFVVITDEMQNAKCEMRNEKGAVGGREAAGRGALLTSEYADAHQVDCSNRMAVSG